MYLIDGTYFARDLQLPKSQRGVDIIDSWGETEPIAVLKGALNRDLFDDFDSNVTAGVYVPGVTKWDNLVNGLDYTYQGKDYRWDGLLRQEGSFKFSLLADYTWCEWLRHSLSRQSGVGEVKGNAANSVNVNSTSTFVNIWNRFVLAYQGRESLTPRVYIKRGVPFYDYFNSEGSYVSLIDFLKHNKTDYEDADLLTYEFANEML